MQQNKVGFTQQQVSLLKRMYPAPEVFPGADPDKIMYMAGQASVVAYIEKNLLIKPAEVFL